MRRIEVAKLNDTEIAQMFSDYVARMEDKERHTKAACKEVDAFDLFCASEFPRNVRLQSLMFEKMMNCAVEFEESGFIAGFKTATALLQGQEEALQGATQITTPNKEQRLLETIPASKDNSNIKKQSKSSVDFRKNPPDDANFVEDGFVKSTQIAEMFGQTNAKVVKRIETQILPYCGKEVEKHFIKVDGYNIQHKKCVFYKMDEVACRLYMKEMEPKKSTFVNIAGGIAKLEELLQKMYPTKRVVMPM